MRAADKIPKPFAIEKDGDRVIKRDKSGAIRWSDTPMRAGQSDIEKAYELDPIITAVYNLSDAKDLAAYNELQAQAHITDTIDPKVIINTQTNFHNGNYYVLVMYQKVWYKISSE